MREIGSEFWNVEICSHPHQIFPRNTQWYLSGRVALRAIIKKIGCVGTVSMPAWFCDSMVRPFLDAGFKVKYYPVYFDCGLRQEIDMDADVLFVMDYFGYTTGNTINHPCIIRDVTHSLFSRDYGDAQYYFGSLRKWCGVWTGGYAWTTDSEELCEGTDNEAGYILLRSKAMSLKNYYINGIPNEKGELVTDKHYLDVFEDAEEKLENASIETAANRDIDMASLLDIEFIKSRRRKNASILMNAFPEMLIFPELKNEDCPMFVPILVPDGKRDALRKFLIGKKIYCPVHWPVGKYHKLDERTAVLYRDGLSLVCDQRYSQENMERIIDAVREFMED